MTAIDYKLNKEECQLYKRYKLNNEDGFTVGIYDSNSNKIKIYLEKIFGHNNNISDIRFKKFVEFISLTVGHEELHRAITDEAKKYLKLQVTDSQAKKLKPMILKMIKNQEYIIERMGY